MQMLHYAGWNYLKPDGSSASGPSSDTYFGQIASKTFTVSSSAPSTCTDPAATNNGGPLPCTYPLGGSTPTCSSVTPTGDTVTVANGTRRTFVSGVSNTTNVHYYVWSNFNSYTATSVVDLDYFESFIKGYGFPVIFHRTDNGLPELDGIRGHYLKINEITKEREK